MTHYWLQGAEARGEDWGAQRICHFFSPEGRCQAWEFAPKHVPDHIFAHAERHAARGEAPEPPQERVATWLHLLHSSEQLLDEVRLPLSCACT